MTNFQVCEIHKLCIVIQIWQVAGCTLDAGAKIYAGRVDAIYNDVYKMLGGFGCANKQDKGKGVFCHVMLEKHFYNPGILFL